MPSGTKYQVTAIKKGVKMQVKSLQVDESTGEITAVWYKNGGLFPWDFVKDIDELKIEERR